MNKEKLILKHIANIIFLSTIKYLNSIIKLGDKKNLSIYKFDIDYFCLINKKIYFNSFDFELLNEINSKSKISDMSFEEFNKNYFLLNNGCYFMVTMQEINKFNSVTKTLFINDDSVCFTFIDEKIFCTIYRYQDRYEASINLDEYIEINDESLRILNLFNELSRIIIFEAIKEFYKKKETN